MRISFGIRWDDGRRPKRALLATRRSRGAARARRSRCSGDAVRLAPAPVHVLVVAAPERTAAAARLTKRIGGTVRIRLRIVDGFTAPVPRRALGRLEASRAVRAVRAHQARVAGVLDGVARSLSRAPDIETALLDLLRRTRDAFRVKVAEIVLFSGGDDRLHALLVAGAVERRPQRYRAGARRSAARLRELRARGKAINDARGHAAGDAVLCEVGERIPACVRPDDLAARLGATSSRCCSRTSTTRTVRRSPCACSSCSAAPRSTASACGCTGRSGSRARAPARSARSPHDNALMRMLVDLGELFGIHVVAEGVEREDQLAALRQTGVRAGSGLPARAPDGGAAGSTAGSRGVAACGSLHGMNRINVDELDFAYEDDDPEGFRSGMKRFGPRLGAAATGISIYELPPGQAICPYHYEYAEEEWLVVLEGRPTLRVPGGSHELRPWDVAFFETGPGGAHGVRNETDEVVRVMMFSDVRLPAATVYPDSDKVGVWTGNREDDVMVPRSARVGYFHGEAGG